MENNAVTQVLTLKNIAAWKKKELSDLAVASVAEVAENGEDTLALLSLAAKLEHFAGEVKKAAKDRGISDLAKFDKGSTSIAGVKLVLKETGVSYDYGADQPWVERNEEVVKAVAKRKEWEDYLSGLPRGGNTISDPDTGVLYHAYPPVRTAKESITATIL